MEINSGILYEFTHHYKIEEFKKGRANFLQTVLTKNYIYRTDEFRHNYEKKARDNIQKEIQLYSN
jgi:predicted metal-dependent HD superfamily phosphohydrolase